MFGMGKLNMAIMGTGYMAGVMAQTIRSVSGVRAYAVASRDLDRAHDFGRDNGFKKAYGSYEELVQDRKVDLVYIATPTSEHYDNMRLCIEHGKNVLCEKPFTLNAAQAREIFTMAQAQRVFISEAMWLRCLPLYKQIRDVLSSRVIGDPVMLSADIGSGNATVRRVADPSLGGGVLMDQGINLLSLAGMLLGDDIVQIHSACTVVESGADMQCGITLTYRSGAMAVLSASAVGFSDQRAVVQGTRGYLVIENVTDFESVSVYDGSGTRVGFYKRPRQKTGYEHELRAVVSALQQKWEECPEMPHSMTLSTLHMTDYIRRQARIVFPQERAQEQDDQLLGDDLLPEEESAQEDFPEESAPAPAPAPRVSPIPDLLERNVELPASGPEVIGQSPTPAPQPEPQEDELLPEEDGLLPEEEPVQEAPSGGAAAGTGEDQA